MAKIRRAEKDDEEVWEGCSDINQWQPPLSSCATLLLLLLLLLRLSTSTTASPTIAESPTHHLPSPSHYSLPLILNPETAPLTPSSRPTFPDPTFPESSSFRSPAAMAVMGSVAAEAATMVGDGAAEEMMVVKIRIQIRGL